MPKLEMFGSSTCPWTSEMREWLEWTGRDFEEYDVDHDPAALARLQSVSPSGTLVPVLLEDGRPVEIGWHGRGCYIGGAGR